MEKHIANLLFTLHCLRQWSGHPLWLLKGLLYLYPLLPRFLCPFFFDYTSGTLPSTNDFSSLSETGSTSLSPSKNLIQFLLETLNWNSGRVKKKVYTISTNFNPTLKCYMKLPFSRQKNITSIPNKDKSNRDNFIERVKKQVLVAKITTSFEELEQNVSV